MNVLRPDRYPLGRSRISWARNMDCGEGYPAAVTGGLPQSCRAACIRLSDPRLPSAKTRPAGVLLGRHPVRACSTWPRCLSRGINWYRQFRRRLACVRFARSAHPSRRARQPGRRLRLPRRQGQPPGADLPRAARVRYRARARSRSRSRTALARSSATANPTAATGSPTAARKPPGPPPIALFTRLALGASPDEMKPTVERVLAVESRVDRERSRKRPTWRTTSTCRSSAGRGPRRTSGGSNRPRGRVWRCAPPGWRTTRAFSRG